MSNLQKTNAFIELTLTNNCNCNCLYCFEHDHISYKRNIIEEERQINLVKEFCKTCQDKYNFVTFSLWGGEPFLNTEFMYKIINETYKYDFVRYHIYTNGTLYDKFEDFIQQPFFESIKNRIHIQLSYDGEPHHTLKRGNTRELVFKTMNLLQKNKVTTYFKATLTFDMIPKLTEIWDSYKDAYDRFGSCVHYSPTLDTGCSGNDKILEEWKKQLITIAKREYKFYKQTNEFLMSWFYGDKPRNCGINNSLHLNTDGNIYICHGCPYVEYDKKKLILGTTSNIQSFNDVLNENIDTNEVPEKCKLCGATYCAVCHVNNLKDSKNIYSDWIKCKVNNTERCKFFEEFGKINRLLKFSLI